MWEDFTARAEALGMAVMRTPSAETASSLLREVTSGFTCTAETAARYPEIGATAGDNRDEVVAAAEFAVAETGSVALDEPPADRGRCFLAERLWLLVPEHEIVNSLDEALTRIGQLIASGAGHPVLMSGPSRTADIERVLTIGVHGPRAVVILVVG